VVVELLELGVVSTEMLLVVIVEVNNLKVVLLVVLVSVVVVNIEQLTPE